MRARTLMALGLAMVAAGCGSHAKSASQQPTSGAGGKPYPLFTHCGIEWARIDGTFWRATHPLSDGNGNPPAGWGNPYQNGTLDLISRRSARFTSSAGDLEIGGHAMGARLGTFSEHRPEFAEILGRSRQRCFGRSAPGYGQRMSMPRDANCQRTRSVPKRRARRSRASSQPQCAR